MKCTSEHESHPLCRFREDPSVETWAAARVWTRINTILLERELAELEQDHPEWDYDEEGYADLLENGPY